MNPYLISATVLTLGVLGLLLFLQSRKVYRLDFEKSLALATIDRLTSLIDILRSNPNWTQNADARKIAEEALREVRILQTSFNNPTLELLENDLSIMAGKKSYDPQSLTFAK